jgi:hypothetical protein
MLFLSPLHYVNLSLHSFQNIDGFAIQAFLLLKNHEQILLILKISLFSLILRVLNAETLHYSYDLARARFENYIKTAICSLIKNKYKT